jgi:hypothetical protein
LIRAIKKQLRRQWGLATRAVGGSGSCQINGIINSTKGWFQISRKYCNFFPTFKFIFWEPLPLFPVFEFEKRRLNALVVPAMPVGRYFLFAGVLCCHFCTSRIGMCRAWPPSRPILRSPGRSSVFTQSINGPPPSQSTPTSKPSIRRSVMTFRRRRLTPIVPKTNRKMRPSLMLLRFFLKPHLNQSALRPGLRCGQCAACT